MKKISINLSINTDGDFDFTNDDEYFTLGFEEYSVDIVIGEKDFKNQTTIIDNIFSEMNKRVFNHYGQKEHLVELVQNLSPTKDASYLYEVSEDKESADNIYLLDNPFTEFLEDGFYSHTYMDGNQVITLNISYIKEVIISTSDKINKCLSDLSDCGLRYSQVFEIIRTRFGGDIFNLSDEKLLTELEKLVETSVKPQVA